MNQPITLRTLIITNGLTILLFVTLLLVSGTAANSLQQTTSPQTTTISYQGNLTDSASEPINATLPMTFKLYGTSTGGSAIWTEERTGANAVPVSSGLFSVLLGSVTPLETSLFGEPLWLGISVNGDAEMTPREQLSATTTAAGPRLLAEKTCDRNNTGTPTEENLSRGRHTVKCDGPQDPMEVTVTTSGRPIVVHMTADYFLDPAQETYCSIAVSQNGQSVDIVELEGGKGENIRHACSSSYVFTDLPAGTYTFAAQAGIWGQHNQTTVTWKHRRQIVAFEY
ncbi:MAG: hypothetical protein HC837_16230 [Chloroflexaceae bacterium]|nr:hypothetical protein [Chloroflexaceae bacterium]